MVGGLCSCWLWRWWLGDLVRAVWYDRSPNLQNQYLRLTFRLEKFLNTPLNPQKSLWAALSDKHFGLRRLGNPMGAVLVW